MGTGCASITVHESYSYSEGIMPDYGAKQGALSVSLPVLGEDSGSGLDIQLFLATPPPDSQASNKTTCDGCVFSSLC